MLGLISPPGLHAFPGVVNPVSGAFLGGRLTKKFDVILLRAVAPDLGDHIWSTNGLLGIVDVKVNPSPHATQALRPNQSADTSSRNLYDEHCKGVYRLAVHLCGREAAASVTQEVFVLHWRSPHLFDEAKGTLRVHLLKLTHQESAAATKSRHTRLPGQPASSSPRAMRAENRDATSGLDRGTSVTRALETLPKALSDAIATVSFGACTYREAATVLGATEETIKTRIRRGMELMRQSLRDTDLDHIGPVGVLTRDAK